GTTLDFSEAAGAETKREAVTRALTETVRAEGLDGETRFERFSRAFGFFLGCVARGEMPLEMAINDIRGWNDTKMLPAWSEELLYSHIVSLMKKHAKDHGPLPVAAAALPRMPEWAKALTKVEAAVAPAKINLDDWGIDRWE